MCRRPIDPTQLLQVLAGRLESREAAGHCLLGSVGQGGGSANNIASQLELSPSLVSHHLRLLRVARVVKADRQGKQVFYATADQHVSGVLADMLEHIAEPHPDSD